VRNQLPANAVKFVPASAAVQGPFDVALIRAYRKTLALLNN
jgi:16S rRNA (guanine1207-N2)-methyltransferase